MLISNQAERMRIAGRNVVSRLQLIIMESFFYKTVGSMTPGPNLGNALEEIET